MITKYSKASSDISTEFKALIDKERYLVEGSVPIKQMICDEAQRRECCSVCGHDIGAEDVFEHQGTPFIQCSVCTHVQSKFLITGQAQAMLDAHLSYSAIYPELDREKYVSRRKAVYEPKLDFLFDVLADQGLSEDEISQKKWLEIGSGAGYLLSGLEQRGCKDVTGLDRDLQLIETNKAMLSYARLIHTMDSMDKLVSQNAFDILVSIFVMEHVNDLVAVQKALRAKEKGCVFYFSVPFFSMASLLEGAVDQHYARNLDGVVHQQAFTENSMNYFLKSAGYKKIGEWVFGQDAMDLMRFLMVRLGEKYPPSLLAQLSEKINGLIDPLQAVIDQACMADARHIVAIKE